MARPKIEERYTKGQELIHFIVYTSTTLAGDDEVLQHKLVGVAETAHITIHPNSPPQLSLDRGPKEYIVKAVRSDMAGFTPVLSDRVKHFIARVKASTALN